MTSDGESRQDAQRCHVTYGDVIDKAARKNISICRRAGQDGGLSRVYVSQSNLLHIVFTATASAQQQQQQHNFIIHVEGRWRRFNAHGSYWTCPLFSSLFAFLPLFTFPSPRPFFLTLNLLLSSSHSPLTSIAACDVTTFRLTLLPLLSIRPRWQLVTYFFNYSVWSLTITHSSSFKCKYNSTLIPSFLFALSTFKLTFLYMRIFQGNIIIFHHLSGY